MEGAQNPAEQYLREAFDLLADLGRPFEAERILIDLAELQLDRGRIAEARDLGRQILARIPKHGHSRKATNALVDIANCLVWRDPTLSDLAEVKSELVRASIPGPPPGMCPLPNSSR